MSDLDRTIEAMVDGRPARVVLDASPYTAEEVDQERTAAFVAGYELGMAQRVELDAEQRAHQLLHERSLEMLGMARREAAKKGPAWAEMLESSAARPWEASP